MKLYNFAMAPNPKRVAIFIAEKGVEIETIEVNIRAGEHKTPAFTAINPLQDLPLLQLDDGTHINQVNAICRYIDDVFPEPPLYGRTPEERAKVESWNHRVQMEGIGAVTDAFRNSSPNFVGRAIAGPHSYEQIPALAERGRLRIDNFMKDMNAHFADNQFVLGDYFSVVDITVFMSIEFATWVKKKIPEDCTHLQRWFDAMSARPSIKK